MIGLVDAAMSPFDVAVQAIADVQAECREVFQGEAPPFALVGRGHTHTLPYLSHTRTPRDDEPPPTKHAFFCPSFDPIMFPSHVFFSRKKRAFSENSSKPQIRPRHLYKILRDVLRASAAAAMRRKHAATASGVLGASAGEIRVVISDSPEQSDVVIKVADEAGGVPRSRMKSIFSFAAGSSERDIAGVLADQQLCRSLGALTASPTESSAGGLVPHDDAVRNRNKGHGLPIARVYARYFKGDLRMRSMDGYGTDAYIYVSRVGDNILPT